MFMFRSCSVVGSLSRFVRNERNVGRQHGLCSEHCGLARFSLGPAPYLFNRSKCWINHKNLSADESARGLPDAVAIAFGRSAK